VLARRNRVFAFFTNRRHHFHHAFTFGCTADFHDTIDVTDNCRIISFLVRPPLKLDFTIKFAHEWIYHVYQIRFKDLSGQLIASTSWQGASLPAHSSVAGDDLELIIQGYTTWAQYELTVSVDWVDGNGAAHSVNFEHRVGNYTSEWYYDSAPRHYWVM
jgi:hypothetical protein